MVAWILLAVLSSANTSSSSPNQSSAPTAFSQEILAAHNRYRKAAGVPPLQWSEHLAHSAQAWANTLTEDLQFAHSHVQGQGENLWMGTAGAFTLTDMIDGWGSEKQSFRNGTFPDVSATGNWFDVGHYTQMVWRDTTKVGCAGASGSDGNYRFVCRYSPPGNVIGERVY
ncbi:MAG TPA: CAP domain-containing protein [Candidatus Cybelea sp.]|nr:CAP domain-containing protein [Candidatus Cybelea sp.]